MQRWEKEKAFYVHEMFIRDNSFFSLFNLKRISFHLPSLLVINYNFRLAFAGERSQECKRNSVYNSIVNKLLKRKQFIYCHIDSYISAAKNKILKVSEKFFVSYCSEGRR